LRTAAKQSPDPPPQPTHADPEEVDISEHFYEPKTTVRPRINNAFDFPTPGQGPSDDQLKQMMLGFDPNTASLPGANPFAGFPGMGGMPGMEGMGPGDMPGADDPLMKMLQQMMGGMGEGPGGMPTFPGMPSMPGQAPASTADSYAYLWRIIHAVFALGLGLYIAFTTTFTGTRVERERSGLKFTAAEDDLSMSPASVHFFWIFATVEVILQTSRFFLEKGRVQQGGIIGMIMGFLPEPYKGYLALLNRYSRIWTTVTGDVMVLVFVLGVCAWLRSA
jgi:hypothetical protein